MSRKFLGEYPDTELWTFTEQCRNCPKWCGINPEELKKQLTAEFNDKFANPYVAASNGSVDSVIDPAQTRPMLIRALEMLANKRDKQLPRKHGNINL